ncbi:MAG: hypothetical protein WEB59_13565 [Thermoanaerobaculia bacterium]
MSLFHLRLLPALLLAAQVAGPPPTPTPKGKAPAAARQPVAVPAERAKELKAAYDSAIKANQTFLLAQKDWESKYNAWMAAEYKTRYELNVPQDFVLNLELGVFEPKEASGPLNPASAPK